MSITIYDYGTTVARATVEPDTTSEQSVTLMGEDTLTLSFVSKVFIPFQIGDYCYWFGKLYQVNVLPKFTENSDEQISYTLTLESEMYDLGKVQLLFLDSNNQFTESIFSFRGTPKDYLDLIIYNLQRVFPLAGWIIGSVIGGDFITTDFSAQNCLEALKTVATAYNTEYLIEGKVINLYQRQTSSGLTLSRGKGKGLLQLTSGNQNNANVITRLYAFGSTRNIGTQYNSDGTVLFSYRGGLPNLVMGDIFYIEKNVDLYRIFEQTVIFDGTTKDQNGAPLPEIYPNRTGTVTFTIDYLNFTDEEIDFDINEYLISGVTPQIVFNTGLLAGYTFDIHEFNYGSKQFTINQNTEEPSLVVPSAAIIMQAGDQYVITNIRMPQSYIDAAEAALKAAAQDYLDANAIPPVAYSGNCDAIYFQKKNVKFSLGQSIAIVSNISNINTTTRITSYTRNVRNPYLYSMGFANTVPASSLIVQIINGL